MGVNILMWINNRWYSETEIASYIEHLKHQIKELEQELKTYKSGDKGGGE